MADFTDAYPGSSGAFYGQAPPKLIVGNYYRPYGFGGPYTATGGTGVTNRMYFFPVPVVANHAYQGAAVKNIGTSDNGNQMRLMMFNDDLANGGPGTLAKDFGVVTCNATARLLLASSSWTPTKPLYYGAVWFSAAINIAQMAPWFTLSAVGFGSGLTPLLSFLGDPTGAQVAVGDTAVGYWGSATFGAAPATAPAITNLGSQGNGVNGINSDTMTPFFQLLA